MSQLSDVFSSSLYEGEDNQLSLFSESQQTIVSHTDPALCLNQPPFVPTSLKRSADRIKTWVIFEEMSKIEFLNWWFETQAGANESTQKQLQWDGRKQNTDLWSQFEQVAHYKTGEPRVMCKNCGKVLGHPSFGKPGTRNGTSTLRRHQNSCRREIKQGKQPKIQHLIQNTVNRKSDEIKV